MGRVTGGDLVIELKADVADLKRALSEMERKMDETIRGLGVVVREGFADVGRTLDRFTVHLEAQADALGELTAKVNDHEDRLAALEGKA